MKSTCIISLLLLLNLMSFAQSIKSSEPKYGVLFMGGTRYDDVRRCVATSPGTKGGPMADIMLTRFFKLSETKSLRISLPVMRPILFAVAFKMLQFEPEANLFINSTSGESKKLFLSPGLGLSLNYGPDYMSDNGEDAERFFSVGPTFSMQSGLKLGAAKTSSVSFRVFYTPLFASGVGTNGTVLGASIQYWFGLGS